MILITNPSGASTAFAVTLSTDSDDLNLAGHPAVYLENDTGGLLTITGLAAEADGTVKTILNGGTNAVLLSGEDTESAAANRFAFALLLSPGARATVRYNGSLSRWEGYGD